MLLRELDANLDDLDQSQLSLLEFKCFFSLDQVLLGVHLHLESGGWNNTKL